jgi:putative membrane protein
MKRIILTRRLVAAAAVTFIGSAFALLPAQAEDYQNTTQQQQPSGASTGGGTISNSDRSFVKEAAQGGQAEVRMGELGQQKATSADVKNLAKTLSDDHQKANDELANIAKSKGVDLPSGIGSTQQSAISDLESKQGPEFDRQFVMIAIRDHKGDIAVFEQASRQLTDPDLRAFAQKTLPVLRNHLQLAEQAAKSISSGNSGNMQR